MEHVVIGRHGNNVRQKPGLNQGFLASRVCLEVQGGQDLLAAAATQHVDEALLEGAGVAVGDVLVQHM